MQDSQSHPELHQTPALMRTSQAKWVPPSAPANEAPENTGEMSRYWHAFRRRWMIAIMVAVPLSALATYGAWFFQPKVFISTAILKVASTDFPFVFQTADSATNGGGGGNAFEIYKRTQRQWMRSRFVISRALRDVAALSKLSVLRDAIDALERLGETLEDDGPTTHFDAIQAVGLAAAVLGAAYQRLLRAGLAQPRPSSLLRP
jgi:uncharacterized protein involved in exopolysaccharide biosynthesis